MHTPEEGSEEHKMLEVLKKPREWAQNAEQYAMKTELLNFLLEAMWTPLKFSFLVLIYQEDTCWLWLIVFFCVSETVMRIMHRIEHPKLSCYRMF